MKILIVCLRRSGSTEFWKVFRQDRRLLCFDEPFNPMLKDLPRRFLKRTNTEFIDLYNKDPELFQNMFQAINYKSELNNLIDEELDYLNFLFKQSKNVIIDATRINFKFDHVIPKLDKDIFVVHLYRNPKAFTSSHILANRTEFKNLKIRYFKSRMKYFINKNMFWRLKKSFNDWGYETIASYLDCDNNVKAYEKLIYIWKLSFETVEKSLENKENKLSISFEEFAKNPEKIIKKIYETNKLEYFPLDYSSIREPNRGYKPDSIKWKMAMQEARINYE